MTAPVQSRSDGALNPDYVFADHGDLGPKAGGALSMKDVLGIKDANEKAEDEQQKAREKTTYVLRFARPY